MARGRMISKSLSTSAKIAALYTICPKMAEFCRALFPLLVSHADDHGRLPGDEFTVKMQVDPITPRKLPEFVAALHFMAEVGLITWYQVHERKVIEIVKFSEHQDLKGHDKRPPKLPPCTATDQLIGRHRAEVGENGDSIKGKGSEFTRTETNLTQSGAVLPTGFDVFWMAYPKKKSKDAARKAFEKRAVSDDLLRRMLDAIEWQKQTRDWTKDGGQYIPNPATWLNGAGWEDEQSVPVPAMNQSTASVVAALRQPVRYDA